MRRDRAAERKRNKPVVAPLGNPRRQLGMRCPSCGAISENADCCVDFGIEANQNQGLDSESPTLSHDPTMNSAGELPTPPLPSKSTLIEFPGVNRVPVPEWRKELSERVREVQERKAREAAREASKIEQQRIAAAVSPPQLELLPPTEMPAMNPLVAAALKRIERAHQITAAEVQQPRNLLAAAIAYAPALEANEPKVLPTTTTPAPMFEPEVDAQICNAPETPPLAEKNHNLVVVPTEDSETITSKVNPMRAPKRLIVDDPNDPALNYLDSISRTLFVEEIDSRRPSAFRRLVCGVFDLIICALLSAPIALAMRATGTNLQDHQAIAVLVGSLVVVTFIYLTLTTALTGRTWAMRLLSLRVIDTKTGLIPTGSQSISRSFLYLVGLALAGLGILFALVSREGYTAHDRFTRTAVIGT